MILQNNSYILFCVDIEGGVRLSMLAKFNRYTTFYSTGGKTKDLALSYQRNDYKVAEFDLARSREKDCYPYSFSASGKKCSFALIISQGWIVSLPKVI